MPCYEIRTISVEFKGKNIKLIKRTMKNLGFSISYEVEGRIVFNDSKFDQAFFDMKNGILKTRNSSSESLTDSIKKAYSLEAIQEAAKKNKWMFKKLNEKQFQIQRF